MSADRPSGESMAAPVAIDPRKVWVPLAVVAGGVAMLVGLGMAAFNFHLYLQAQFTGLTVQLQALDRRLERMEERDSDRWSGTDMRLWTLELSRQNPTLAVPAPLPAAAAQPARRPR